MISIHAPQWGATTSQMAGLQVQQFQSTHPSGVRLVEAPPASMALLFQSTHPSGVRRVSANTGARSSSFQSTHPSGVRPFISAIFWANWFISIHAPQWGATIYHCDNRESAADFNPRTPVGCDREQACPPSFRCYFNPRTPVGCDDLQHFSIIKS